MTTEDLMKPFESMKSLITAQADVISKTVSLQQKAGEELASYLKNEMEKVQTLKSPEDVLKFNTESTTGLFELLKGQGEAFKEVAEEAQSALMAEVTSFAK